MREFEAEVTGRDIDGEVLPGMRLVMTSRVEGARSTSSSSRRRTEADQNVTRARKARTQIRSVSGLKAGANQDHPSTSLQHQDDASQGAGVLLVLFQVVPPLLTAHFNRSLGAIYKRLETVERSFGTRDFDEKAALETLDELQRDSAQLRIPLPTLRAPYFEMRQNIHDVRARVEGRG